MKLFTTAALVVSACAGLVAAAPASAEQATTVAGSASTVAGSPAPKTKVQSDNAKYCVMVEATTGTRISRRRCLTKGEWEALGVDTASFR